VKVKILVQVKTRFAAKNTLGIYFVTKNEPENNRGTVRHYDLYAGRVTIIKGSGFVNSRSRDQSEISERLVRDSSDRCYSGVQCVTYYNQV
jgi:hypothetical protein